MKRTGSGVVALLALAGGCGGNGGGNGAGGSCMQEAACGGNVVGTWAISQSCVTFVQDYASVCPGLSATGTVAARGTVSYRADQTYTQSATFGGAFHIDYSSTCLQGRTCPQQQAALQASGSALGQFTSVSCHDNGGGCLCDAILIDSPDNETGTWAVTGTTLATTHDGMTDGVPFCVMGNVMQQRLEGPVGSGATTAGYLGLTKQ